jgi:autotransporter-associated beta strand protein
VQSIFNTGLLFLHFNFCSCTDLENGNTTARSAFFDVGADNSFQSGIGILVFNDVISQTGSAAVNLQKRNGGVLVLKADNSYAGSTNVLQGRLVLANTGAAGLAGSTINLNNTNGRPAHLELLFDGPGPFTVMAPTNAAFNKVPKATLNAIANDHALLTQVLTYHVVSGKVTSKQVAKLNGKAVKTVQGSRFTVSVKPSGIYLNNPWGFAMVTKADIGASNGVIHAVDQVLVPQAVLKALAG